MCKMAQAKSLQASRLGRKVPGLYYLQACEFILGKARGAGIGAGIHHWLTPEKQVQFVNMGANLLIHKADVTIFQNGLQKELGEIRTLLGYDPNNGATEDMNI